MWAFRSEELADNRGLRFVVDGLSQPATFADVIRGWQNASAFRSLFNDSLANAPFQAFHREGLGRPKRFLCYDR